MMSDKNYHSRQNGRLSRLVTRLRRVVLIAPGAIIIQLAPALALDGSDAGAQKSVPKSFTSGQEALRVGEEDLRAGNIEASVAALTYAAESGQAIARWKLGQMYADGDGVPSDASKAYYYLNKLVEDYDEDQPDPQDESAVSDAFVAVGVYCSKRHTEQRREARPAARARIVPIRGNDVRRSERTVQSCPHVHDRRGRSREGQHCGHSLAGASSQTRPLAIASLAGTYAFRW